MLNFSNKELQEWSWYAARRCCDFELRQVANKVTPDDRFDSVNVTKKWRAIQILSALLPWVSKSHQFYYDGTSSQVITVKKQICWYVCHDNIVGASTADWEEQTVEN